MNRQRVVDAIRDHGSLTQVEIAHVTGLSQATVSNMVRELDAIGAVDLAPSIRNGRRATLVSASAPAGLLAAIVFGDRDVRVAVGETAQRVLLQQRMPLPFNHAADEGMERSCRLLFDLLEEQGAPRERVSAVVVGLPAPVDSVSGQVGSQTILPGWRGVSVSTAIAEVLSAPVELDNTANLAALGEFKNGALQGFRHGIYIKASYGIGAGLILNGELFRGSAGTAGEIGHITLDENGPVCRCGNRGCLDTFVGSAAVLAALRDSHGPLTLRDVITRALDGDLGCRRVLEDAAHHIGVAAAGVVNLLNPEVIVLGGQVARAGEIVLRPLREAIERCAIPSAAHSLQVRAGAHADEADVVGALTLAGQLRDQLESRPPTVR